MSKAPRKQPPWRKDRRRGFLVALDYQAIYKAMNAADVPRGHARALAHEFGTSISTILAIAGARAGLRHLGAIVKPLPAGLRAFKPTNRDAAVRTRGLITQQFIYRRLMPKKQEGK